VCATCSSARASCKARVYASTTAPAGTDAADPFSVDCASALASMSRPRILSSTSSAANTLSRAALAAADGSYAAAATSGAPAHKQHTTHPREKTHA
jgi:hypothetical protein